jgi:hypothetical protein
MFLKVKSQQGPEVRTFLAGYLHEEVVIECRWNPPNPLRNNLFHSFFGFLVTHLSEAGGCLEFGVRNLFGGPALALRRFQIPWFRGLNARGGSLVSNGRAPF